MESLERVPEPAAETSAAGMPAVAVEGVSRSFGHVHALRDATLTISRGGKLGLIGHNGAGKSTLMNVLLGVLRPDRGAITVGGETLFELTPRQSYELGIRGIFQELSLCPNLTAVENTLIRHRDIAGWGWRGRARRLIGASLDRIFEGHGIDIDRPLETLSIAQRQMVEIAEAFAVVDEAPRLVILDEPTSSLDAKAADQLMHFLDVASREGIATILISHRLQEILTYTDRVVIMVDGRIIGDVASKSLTREALVAKMGHLEASSTKADRRSSQERGGRVVLAVDGATEDPLRFVVREGEVVGFAGLDGHGQRNTLLQVFTEVSKGRAGLERDAVAYVPGDRQTEGVFPIWSVGENTTVRSLRDMARRGFIDLARERALAADWFKRVGVRTSGADAGIGTLSGGNQQKVLFARALASRASLVLLDDPMRGVDVGTKSEVYALIRKEAAGGRSFVWYSTETEELKNCDRVYVFRTGRIVAALDAAEITEENILRASFTDPTGDAEAANV